MEDGEKSEGGSILSFLLAKGHAFNSDLNALTKT
jgi:hypothetical protein